tara:strand:- start:398 stop:514 length:117 start_codon:yes stop_codon:yes gene_type:complete
MNKNDYEKVWETLSKRFTRDKIIKIIKVLKEHDEKIGL